MRIWDLPVECLCRNHLLAEHRELHAIWSIILYEKSGYSRHPEVMRWRGRLKALWNRHESQCEEMARRGYSHVSPLDPDVIPEEHQGNVQTVLVDELALQKIILKGKGCTCDSTERDAG